METSEINLDALPEPVPIAEHRWPKETTPLVSIVCATYNHEAFIRDAIEGFLMQETTFPVEILIHDDASRDRTPDVVKDYAEKYPLLIKPILQSANQLSGGVKPTHVFQLPCALGQYFAFCEGDDYWCYPHKLEKQVAILESDLSIALTFHQVFRVKNGEKVERPKWPCYYTGFVDFEKISKLEVFTPPTSSILVRRSVWNKEFFRGPYGDRMWAISAGLVGNLYGLEDSWSVYRLHEGGIATGSSASQRLLNDSQSRFLISSIFPISQSTLRYHERRIRSNVRNLLRHLEIKKPWQNSFKTVRCFGYSSYYWLRLFMRVARGKSTNLRFVHRNGS